ncbi:MAG: hypothetical protein WBA25_18985 [Jannaschia sp.]
MEDPHRDISAAIRARRAGFPPGYDCRINRARAPSHVLTLPRPF